MMRIGKMLHRHKIHRIVDTVAQFGRNEAEMGRSTLRTGNGNFDAEKADRKRHMGGGKCKRILDDYQDGTIERRERVGHRNFGARKRTYHRVWQGSQRS